MTLNPYVEGLIPSALAKSTAAIFPMRSAITSSAALAVAPAPVA